MGAIREWTATFGEAVCPLCGDTFSRKVKNHTYCDGICAYKQHLRNQSKYKKARRQAMKGILAQAQAS